MPEWFLLGSSKAPLYRNRSKSLNFLELGKSLGVKGSPIVPNNKKGNVGPPRPNFLPAPGAAASAAGGGASSASSGAASDVEPEGEEKEELGGRSMILINVFSRFSQFSSQLWT